MTVALVPPATSDDVLVPQSVVGLRLDALCDSARVRELDELDNYTETRQYDRRRYTWDGQLVGGYGEDQIPAAYPVPMAARKPSTRFHLAKLIVKRLTAMVFGSERWPEVRIDGDPDAEDYAKALAEAADLTVKFQEARTKGGSCGSVAMSFAFVDGRPRVSVHRAKHTHVLRWADRDEHVIGSVLKVYRYVRNAWDRDGKIKQVTFYFARYWDERVEVVWDPILEADARTGQWPTRTKSHTVVHGYGETPVYWVQNIPDSELEDGHSDIEGLAPEFDSINMILSATTRGTIANVDPTLVIKDDPGKNEGIVRKGLGQAIFSKNGAEYLELEGSAVQTAIELCEKIAQQVLDVTGVVLGDPEKMGIQAQSGEALKFLYMPMVIQADTYRAQYGTKLLVPLLRGMLRAARMIMNTAPGPVLVTSDGRRVQQRPTVILPERVEYEEADPPVGETPPKRPEKKKPKLVPRVPGTKENISLKWPPYFKHTAQDVKERVDAITTAQGKIIGDRTAVKSGADMFDVEDVDAEMQEIANERLQRTLEMPGPEGFPVGMTPPKGAEPEEE